MNVTLQQEVTRIVEHKFEIDCPNHVFIVAINYRGQLKSVFATSIDKVLRTYPGAAIINICRYSTRYYYLPGFTAQFYTDSDAQKPACAEVDLIL